MSAEFNENDNQKLISDYKIVYDSLVNGFPNEFYLYFKNFDNNFKLKLIKNPSNRHNSKVYTIHEGKIKEHEFQGEHVIMSFQLRQSLPP